MADRYWVAATGNWNNTARWSTSSGGSSGASAPTASDDVYFDALSNTGVSNWTVTVNVASAARSVIISGLDAKLTLTFTSTLQVNGSWTSPATANFAFSGTGALNFNDSLSATGGGTITTNGVSLTNNTVSFANGTWDLAGAITQSSASGTLTFTSGTINLNGYTYTVSIFSSNNSNTRVMNFGTGTISVTGTSNVIVIGATGWSCDCPPSQGGATGGFSRTGAAASPSITIGNTTNPVDVSIGAPNLKYSSSVNPTINVGSVVNNLDFTGSTANITGVNATPTVTGPALGTVGVTVAGNLTLASGGTYTSFYVTFRNEYSYEQIFTTAGKTVGGVCQYQNYYNSFDVGTVKLVGNLIVTIAANFGWSQVAGVIDLNGYTLRADRFYKSTLNTAVYGTDIGPYGVYFGSTSITLVSTVLSTTLLNFPDLGYYNNVAIVTSTGGGFVFTGGNGGPQTVTWTGDDVNNAANFTWSMSTGGGKLITTGLNCNNWVSTGTVSTSGSVGVTVYIYGNITLNTISWLAIRFWYNGTGTCTWTNPSSVNCGAFTANGNVSLSGAMTLTNTSDYFGQLDILAGTFTTNSNTLSVGRFSSTGSTTRGMVMGTTACALTATQNSATIFDMGDCSSFTFTGTGGSFTRSVSTATGQTINLPTSFNTIDGSLANFNFITGTAAITFSNAGNLRNLAFQTAYTGVVNAPDMFYVCGDLTLSSAATYTNMAIGFFGNVTQTIAWASKTVLSIGCICQSGGTASFTTSVTCTGAFEYLSGGLTLAASIVITCASINSSSGTRSLTFGSSSRFSVTGSGANILNQSATGLTVSGTYYVLLTYTGSAGVRTITLSGYTASALAPTISMAGTSGIVVTNATDTLRVEGTAGDIDIATTTVFSGTFDVGTGLIVYGNFKIGSPTATQSNTTTLTFGATSSKTITSGGATFNFPITIDGVGGTWTCQDALTLASTKALTMTNGTLALKNGVTSTVGSFVTTGTTLKYLISSTAASSATLSDASGTNTVTYLSIKDSAATGGATFDASDPTNVNAGNNTGWTFPSLATGRMLMMFH